MRIATRASSSQAQRPAESAARLAFALAFGCLASTAACVDYKTDPGYCGTCKVDSGGGQKDAAQDAMSAGDGRVTTGDASHDAGKDAGADGGGGGGGDAGDAGDANVGTDAGPCGKTCGGNTPACDVASSHCVQCTAAEHAACKGTTPVCDTSGHACVQCTAAEHAACTGATPVCDGTSNTCVECTLNTQCLSATASACSSATQTCVQCTTDSDCSQIAGKNVCDAGQCVQCTGAKYTACGKDASDNNLVCDSLAHTCSTTAVELSTGLCGSCISDAQCHLGQLCVEQTFSAQSTGYFCMWHDGAGVGGAPSGCAGARPFVKSIANVHSIDGTVGDICGLRATTCDGYNDYSNPSVNCEPTPNAPDDSMCGAPGLADAYCRFFGVSMSDNIYRCTMPCLSDDDCKSGSTCNTGVTPNVCTL